MLTRFTIFFVILFSICNHANAQRDSLRITDLRFIENKNQWENQVLFKAELLNGAMFFEKSSYIIDLRDQKAINQLLSYKQHSTTIPKISNSYSNIINHHAYRVHFLNSNPEVRHIGFHPSEDYNNYFIGYDPSKHSKYVKKFGEIVYQNIYNGIDLRFFEKENLFKYEFEVEKGIDPSVIKIKYDGVDKIEIKNNNLNISTSVTNVIELKPYTYQVINSEIIEIPCRFKLDGNIITFEFPNGFNKAYNLIIDPTLIFASYSGSTSDNWGYTATYDNDGNLYAGGASFGQGYPTTLGAYKTIYAGGNTDVVITKYHKLGSTLIYSTYLGGSGSEIPSSLVVNSKNELFVMGTTGSSNFPVKSNAFDSSFNGGTADTVTYIIYFPNGSDLFVTRISVNGDSLMASTYLGGSGIDGINNKYTSLKHNYADDLRGEIIVDKNDNCYIVSCTRSLNYPVSANAFQPLYGGNQDGVITKLDNNLSTLIWSSYIGGSSPDAVYSINLDPKGDIYVAGGTQSINFPVKAGAIYPIYSGGTTDGFITKINQTGGSILASTYFGTSVYDQIYFVDNDKYGDVYVLGQTKETGLGYIKNALWNKPGGGQFISKLSPTLDSVKWSTAFGTGLGTTDISPTAFMVDYCNNIYLSGWGGLSGSGTSGTSGLPITTNAFQSVTDNKDYYFLVIKGDASNIVYGTFFGGGFAGEHVDGGTSRFDRKGAIYQAVCAGCGGYSDFPTTPGAWSNLNKSTNCNNGVIKFDFSLPLVIADFKIIPDNGMGCAPYTANFTNLSYTSGTTNVSFFWDFGNGNTSTLYSPSQTYFTSGVYTVSLIVKDSASCNVADTIIKTLVVLSNKLDTLNSINICKGSFTQIGVLPVGTVNITYQWSPAIGLSATNVSNPIASPLNNTTYSLIINNGICKDTLIQKVWVHDLKVDAGNDTIACLAAITLTAKTKNDSVQFQWSSSPYFTNTINLNPNDSTITIAITQPTMFYVKITNKYGCSAIDSILVNFKIYMTNSVITYPKCFGDCNGTATIIPNGGTPPYQYIWSTGSFAQTITNLCAGLYLVTVTDSTGCQALSTISITQPAILSNPITKTDIPCSTACIGQINANTTGGTNPYSWVWSNGSTFASINNLCAGIYSVTAVDANNCTRSDTAEILDLYFTKSLVTTINGINIDSDTIYEGQSVQLSTTFFGSGYTYQWTPATGLSNPSIHNPLASPLVTTTYYISVSDIYGCTYTDSVTIVVLDVICEDPYIFIPNAFTPNGDQKNDILYVRSNVIYTVNLIVFDRWGERVFETSDITKGWDGTFRGKKCLPGVYVYYLEAICYNKVIFKKKGNITLIR